jgi:uncharacterized Fe-S cluster-containing MiaB family protein
VRGRTTWKKKTYKAPWCVSLGNVLAILWKRKGWIPLLFYS